MDHPLVVSPPYIRKPTALIHFERELSVIAQKVMTLIVAHCQEATKNAQGFYFIEKRRVCEFLGWEESHNQPRVVEAFEEIFNSVVIWNLFGQDRTFKSLRCRLIFALLTPEETGRFVGFAVAPLLEPAIQYPKVFGQILFEVPALLTQSEFAFPLYELLADYVSREEGLLRITLADLKRYLGLSRRYAVYADFLKRVLTPSLESINASTDIQVSYETWREGRAIGGFIFRIQRSEPQTPRVVPTKVTINVLETLPPSPSSQWSPEEQAFLDRLVQHQISEEDAAQALRTHGLDGAREVFGFVRQEVMRRKGTPEEIRNVPAYLARCLREGFGRKQCSGRSESDLAAERSAQAVVAEKAEAAKREQVAQQASAQAQFSVLSAAEQAALERMFLQAEPIWSGVAASSMLRAKAFQSWLAKSGLPAPHDGLSALNIGVATGR